MNGKGRVEVTREFIQDVIKANGDIPEDATLLTLEYNPERDIYDAVFVSDRFPETHEGESVKEVHEIEL